MHIINIDSLPDTAQLTIAELETKAYQPNGELTDWQQNIARYAVGNSRLCLALGASFAAPLLSLLNEESGGFHLMGDSPPPLWNLPPLLPACP